MQILLQFIFYHLLEEGTVIMSVGYYRYDTGGTVIMRHNKNT